MKTRMENCRKHIQCDMRKAFDMSLKVHLKVHLELGDKFHTTERVRDLKRSERCGGCSEAFAEFSHGGVSGLLKSLGRGPHGMPYHWGGGEGGAAPDHIYIYISESVYTYIYIYTGWSPVRGAHIARRLKTHFEDTCREAWLRDATF